MEYLRASFPTKATCQLNPGSEGYLLMKTIQNQVGRGRGWLRRVYDEALSHVTFHPSLLSQSPGSQMCVQESSQWVLSCATLSAEEEGGRGKSESCVESHFRSARELSKGIEGKIFCHLVDDWIISSTLPWAGEAGVAGG